LIVSQLRAHIAALAPNFTHKPAQNVQVDGADTASVASRTARKGGKDATGNAGIGIKANYRPLLPCSEFPDA
jgi:hypothetical protein